MKRTQPERFVHYSRDVYPPIRDYALIGDTHTAALISSQGSIDWACFPHFDSPALFLRLLDEQRGGCCTVTLAQPASTTRRYREDTAILETIFTTSSGVLVVTDFMPLQPGPDEPPTEQDTKSTHRLIRLLRCVRGSVAGAVTVKPAFAFATETPTVESQGATVVVFTGQNDVLHVYASGGVTTAKGAAHAPFVLREGERVVVALTHEKPGDSIPCLTLGEAQTLLHETQTYWENWIRQCAYQGEYAALVKRSAITLKLLTFEPTGAIVAAPTTSLPEIIGGERNWDYRFTWLRDATFTLSALMNLGYLGEAHDFFHFFYNLYPHPRGEFQILYGIHGETDIHEKTLPHLEGYRGSRPVRVGNAAATQRQLDIYGELLHCFYLYTRRGGFSRYDEISLADLWPWVEKIARYVVRRWREPDRGIWEVRGPDQHFVHSKAMCWVALDRALKLAAVIDKDEHTALWRQERDAVIESVQRQGFNTEVGAFVQSYGSRALDASLLRLPLLGVLSATDPRMRATIEHIRRDLTHNGLVYRYRVADGLPGAEATFALCTFWLIQNDILLHRLAEAEALFTHVVSFANDVGLFAEEIDPVTGEQLGNFPQAFTHIALINTAVRLAEAKRGRKTPAHAIVEDTEDPFD